MKKSASEAGALVFDVKGCNPLLGRRAEIKRANLNRLLRIILDPKSHPLDIEKAGSNFIKILRGSTYQPEQEQVESII